MQGSKSKRIFKWFRLSFLEGEIESEYTKTPRIETITKYIRLICIVTVINLALIVILGLIQNDKNLMISLMNGLVTFVIFGVIYAFLKRCPEHRDIAGYACMVLFYVVQTEFDISSRGAIQTYINIIITQIPLTGIAVELYNNYYNAFITEIGGIIYITIRLSFEQMPVDFNFIIMHNLYVAMYFILNIFLMLGAKKRLFYQMYNKQKSERSWREIMRTLPDGIIIFRNQNSVKFFNQQSLEFLFLEEEVELSKLEIRAKILGRVADYGLWNDDINSVKIYKITSKEGRETKTRRLEVRTKQIFFQEKAALMMIIRDIEELQKKERIKAEEKYKTMLTDSFQYQLLNPLKALRSNIVETMAKIDSQDLKYNMMFAQNSCQLLSLLMSDITDFSLMDSDGLVVNKNYCKLQPILSELYNFIKVFAQNKNLNLHIKSSKNVPITIYSDRRRLIQILTNLSLNSINFTENGEINILINQKKVKKQLVIEFSVKDTRSDTLLHELREPFSKANQTKSGFRLSICKSIVEALEGILTFKLIPGGCNVIFWIPITEHKYDFNQKPTKHIKISTHDGPKRIPKPPKQELSVIIEQPPTSNANRSDSISTQLDLRKTSLDLEIKRTSFDLPEIIGDQEFRRDSGSSIGSRGYEFGLEGKEKYEKRILMVENDPLLLLGMGQLLNRQGIAIINCHSGKQALQYLKDPIQGPVNAIFISIQLPLGNGFEVIKKMHEFWNEKGVEYIPIVTITQTKTIEIETKCAQLGLKYLEEKPLSPNTIYSLLETLKILQISWINLILNYIYHK